MLRQGALVGCEGGLGRGGLRAEALELVGDLERVSDIIDGGEEDERGRGCGQRAHIHLN